MPNQKLKMLMTCSILQKMRNIMSIKPLLVKIEKKILDIERKNKFNLLSLNQIYF